MQPRDGSRQKPAWDTVKAGILNSRPSTSFTKGVDVSR
jgi:hypothetical protein